MLPQLDLCSDSHLLSEKASERQNKEYLTAQTSQQGYPGQPLAHGLAPGQHSGRKRPSRTGRRGTSSRGTGRPLGPALTPMHVASTMDKIGTKRMGRFGRVFEKVRFQDVQESTYTLSFKFK